VLREHVKRLGLWALTVGSDGGSLEPTNRLATTAWLRGAYKWGPSAYAKHRHLLDVFQERGHRVFIEAGTYRGNTVAFFLSHADEITSVELQDGLYADAVRRFAAHPKVTIVHGDALTEIPRVVAEVSRPPLVFLDGHFSMQGTAVGTEMEPARAMLPALGRAAPPGTTVVIDDLRLFGSGMVGFPQLDELTAAAREGFPDANIRTGLDSVVIEAS